MKKALFIVALYLVPFFSFSNIFEDGTLDSRGPSTKLYWAVDCSIQGSNWSITQQGQVPTEHNTFLLACVDDAVEYYRAYLVANDSKNGYCSITASANGTVVEAIKDCSPAFPFESRNYSKSPSATSPRDASTTNCPPEQDPSFTMPKGADEDGNPTKCFDPAEVHQKDSCNANSGQEYLTIDVTTPTGCYPMSDGSICKYDAVDLGSGNEFYALDLEGDCYENVDDLPELSGTPKPNPVDEACVDYGNSVLGCPANPSDVCSSGSAYSGGSINDCNEGCGMVNDQFMCIDLDTDNDGLPDYNDPDIDGDGIGNDDDLDADGDGNDDPINSGSGNGNGTTEIDLGPVINELKKLNKNFDDQGEQQGIDAKLELTELNNEYQTKLTDLKDKTATELGYTDNIQGLSNRTGLVVPVSNQCAVYSFHPAGKTITLDTCLVAEKVKPILFWLFGFLTAWHIFFTINKTLREGV